MGLFGMYEDFAPMGLFGMYKDFAPMGLFGMLFLVQRCRPCGAGLVNSEKKNGKFSA